MLNPFSSCIQKVFYNQFESEYCKFLIIKKSSLTKSAILPYGKSGTLFKILITNIL
jgi:hypothetical protein